MMEESFFSPQHPPSNSDPPPASTSETLLHLALLLAAPPEAGLLNLREPLSVLGPELLHAAALQEVLLLLLLSLLQNLVSGFELRADFAAAWRLLRDSRPLRVETPPTTAATATTTTTWGQTITQYHREVQKKKNFLQCIPKIVQNTKDWKDSGFNYNLLPARGRPPPPPPASPSDAASSILYFFFHSS